MTFVAFTDAHGDVGDARKVVDLARKTGADFMVCGGDFSEFGERWTEAWQILAQAERKVYFVSGNHEHIGIVQQALKLNPNARFIDSKLVIHVRENGARIQVLGLGGHAEFEPDFAQVQRDPDFLRVIMPAINGKQPLVVVTHYPPSGTKLCGPLYDSAGNITVPVKQHEFYVGSPVVRYVIERLKPHLVLTGHFHERFGFEDKVGETRVVNPGPAGMAFEA